VSNYTKVTNFTAKDSLVTGNPSKLVKGSEIDSELSSVAVAIATKLDSTTAASTYAPLASPALTGVPTAPTATIGTNTTQVATTAFVQTATFSAALPSQTGNGGKFVTTDGTTASWSGDMRAGTIRFVDSSDVTKKVAFDLSGITTGTTRNVTMPDKSGTLAMTSDIPTRALVLLATITPTVAANIDLLTTFTSSYDNYLVMIEGIEPSTSNDALALRVAVGGAAVSSNIYSGASITAGGTLPAATSEYLFMGGAGPEQGFGGMNASFTLMNMNSTTAYKSIQSNSFANASASSYALNYVGVIKTNSVVTGIRLYWVGGKTFAATGKIYVYGCSNT
jgi:hypothetical protein